MAKIYVKTIVMVAFAVLCLLLRLKLLVFASPFPDFLLDVLIGTVFIAVIINEKFTRGEKWKTSHYAILLLALIIILYFRIVLEVN